MHINDTNLVEPKTKLICFQNVHNENTAVLFHLTSRGPSGPVKSAVLSKTFFEKYIHFPAGRSGGHHG